MTGRDFIKLNSNVKIAALDLGNGDHPASKVAGISRVVVACFGGIGHERL